MVGGSCKPNSKQSCDGRTPSRRSVNQRETGPSSAPTHTTASRVPLHRGPNRRPITHRPRPGLLRTRNRRACIRTNHSRRWSLVLLCQHYSAHSLPLGVQEARVPVGLALGISGHDRLSLFGQSSCTRIYRLQALIERELTDDPQNLAGHEHYSADCLRDESTSRG